MRAGGGRAAPWGSTRVERAVVCDEDGSAFSALIHTCVNARESPELARALLAGELNLVRSPTSGAAWALAVPVRYHDPARSILALLIPSSLRHRAVELRAELMRELGASGAELPAYALSFSVAYSAEELLRLEEGAAGADRSKETTRVGDSTREVELVQKREQLDQVSARLERERARMEEVEMNIAIDRAELERARRALSAERTSIERERLAIEGARLSLDQARRGEPALLAERTQKVTKDQVIAVGAALKLPPSFLDRSVPLTAHSTRSALSILEECDTPEGRAGWFDADGFAEDRLEEVRDRVARAAARHGLAMPSSVAERAVELGLAADRASLLEALIATFAESSVGLGADDSLGEQARRANWAALLSEADEVGLEIPSEVRSLARSWSGAPPPPPTDADVGVERPLRLDTMFAPLERADPEALATLLDSADRMEVDELTPLAEELCRYASPIEDALIEAIGEAGSGALYVLAYALARLRSRRALALLLARARGCSGASECRALAAALSQYEEDLGEPLLEMLAQGEREEGLIELLAAIERRRPGSLAQLEEDEREAIRGAASSARTRLDRRRGSP